MTGVQTYALPISTRLLHRKGTDFLYSILGKARVETTKKVNGQSYIENQHFNVNIDGDYKKLYKGFNPFIMSNDPVVLELLKKYKISHNTLPLDGIALIKSFDIPEYAPHNPIIVHINCNFLATKLNYVLSLLTVSIQYFSIIRKMYTIMYPF